MNDKIIGKKVKLNDYNMSYGKQEKKINIICFFKYLKDNSLYAISCEDSNIPYGIVNFGSAHLKENTLIIIGSKDPNQEMIKEILFKINNDENYELYEIQDLQNVELIELVSPNKLEIKKEVLQNVVDKVIPKPVIVEETKQPTKKKKNKLLPILLLLIILGGTSFYLFSLNSLSNQNNIVKSIVCTKESESDSINAKVLEDNTYNFNHNDILEYINKSTTYKFYDEDEYLDFINKGLYYSYLPDESDDGGFSLDDDTYSFTIIEKEDATIDYFLPTEYEEVLSYYKGKGYSCTEKAEE
jgi:hypothetical protein